MTELLYLDYNCFQRSFDDQGQVRIRMEALACEAIFEMAEQGRVRLAWSFMHQDENAECPFLDRKAEVIKLSELCNVEVAPSEGIRESALKIQKQYGVSVKDAIHLACGLHAHARHFITCDDAVRRRTGGKMGNMIVINPTEYVME